MTTFRQVQKQFTAVFGELVDGGVGKLVLQRGASVTGDDSGKSSSEEDEPSATAGGYAGYQSGAKEAGTKTDAQARRQEALTHKLNLSCAMLRLGEPSR